MQTFREFRQHLLRSSRLAFDLCDRHAVYPGCAFVSAH